MTTTRELWRQYDGALRLLERNEDVESTTLAGGRYRVCWCDGDVWVRDVVTGALAGCESEDRPLDLFRSLAAHHAGVLEYYRTH